MTGTISVTQSFDIYASALFDVDVASSYTGGIDTALTADDVTLAEDVEFTPLNLKLLTVIKPEATTPDTEQAYNWGPYSIAGLFGGLMPQNFMLLGHNNATDAVTAANASDNVVNLVGVTYTNV